jgi:hypothetical protein
MMTRYLSGLCVAGLGLCGGGWLIVAAVAFGGTDGGDAGGVNLATGAGLIVVGCITAVAWAKAWRHRMRADGVLGERFVTVSRRQARRNRRELTRDVRRAARSAKASAREARQRARRFPRLANGGLADIGLAGDGRGSGDLGRGGLTGGGLGAGPLADSGLPGSGLSGGGLGEPRGWIGGGRTGYAPHGPARAGQGQAGPGTMEVLVELRTLRALLTPLLEAAGREPVSPPLPQRQPGQERPGIPHQRADQQAEPAGQPVQQADQADQDEQPDEAAQAAQADQAEQNEQDEQPVSEAAGQAGGLIAGEGELLRLADSEEAWW